MPPYLSRERSIAESARRNGLGVAAIGLGVPFIVAALAVESFAAFLAQFRAHLGVVEKAMGGLLVLTGIAFFAGWVSDVGSWLVQAFPDLGKLAM